MIDVCGCERHRGWACEVFDSRIATGPGNFASKTGDGRPLIAAIAATALECFLSIIPRFLDGNTCVVLRHRLGETALEHVLDVVSFDVANCAAGNFQYDDDDEAGGEDVEHALALLKSAAAAEETDDDHDGTDDHDDDWGAEPREAGEIVEKLTEFDVEPDAEAEEGGSSCP